MWGCAKIEAAMGERWERYREKIYELREIFRNRSEGGETEVDILLPGDAEYEPSRKAPYVRIRYYVNDHVHERKVELYEHHLKKELGDLINLIEHFIQEFEMEIDQSEYGGG